MRASIDFVACVEDAHRTEAKLATADSVKPINQHHLYEIHTAPQEELVGAVLSANHILEIAWLRDFL